MTRLKSILTLLSLSLLFSLPVLSQPCQANFYSPGSSHCGIYKTISFINTSKYDTLSKIDFEWHDNGTLISTSANDLYAFTSLGQHTMCLILIDSANGCRDTFCRNFYVSPTKACGIRYFVRDTLDSCTKVFYMDTTLSRVDSVDSVILNFGDGDSIILTKPRSIVHQYAQTGVYRTHLITYGMSGNCRSIQLMNTYVAGCNGIPLCQGTVKGSILLDHESLMDSVNFPARWNQLWNATIYLIHKKGNNLLLVDSIVCDSCRTFSFDSLCNDTFLVKVALQSSDPYYHDFLPTYCYSKLRWDSVTHPYILSGPVPRIQESIQLVKGNNPGGPGFIGGSVFQGANKKEGDPLGRVDVILMDLANNPVAYTYSRKDGSFEFANVAYGSYFIFAEVLGLEIEGMNITLSEATPRIENIKVEVGSDKVSAGMEKDISYLQNVVGIFPNPSSDMITVKTGTQAGTIRISDLSGKEAMIQVTNGMTRMNIESLEPGAYILSFTATDGMTYYCRVVVQ